MLILLFWPCSAIPGYGRTCCMEIRYDRVPALAMFNSVACFINFHLKLPFLCSHQWTICFVSWLQFPCAKRKDKPTNLVCMIEVSDDLFFNRWIWYLYLNLTVVASMDISCHPLYIFCMKIFKKNCIFCVTLHVKPFICPCKYLQVTYYSKSGLFTWCTRSIYMVKDDVKPIICPCKI